MRLDSKAIAQGVSIITCSTKVTDPKFFELLTEYLGAEVNPMSVEMVKRRYASWLKEPATDWMPQHERELLKALEEYQEAAERLRYVMDTYPETPENPIIAELVIKIIRGVHRGLLK